MRKRYSGENVYLDGIMWCPQLTAAMAVSDIPLILDAAVNAKVH